MDYLINAITQPSFSKLNTPRPSDADELYEVLTQSKEPDVMRVFASHPFMFPCSDDYMAQFDDDQRLGGGELLFFSGSLNQARALFRIAMDARGGRLDNWMQSPENGKHAAVFRDDRSIQIGLYDKTPYSLFLANRLYDSYYPSMFYPWTESAHDSSGRRFFLLLSLRDPSPSKLSDALITLGNSGKQEVFEDGKRKFLYPFGVVQAWDALAERASNSTLAFCSVCGAPHFRRKGGSTGHGEYCSPACRQQHYRDRKKAGG